MNKFETATAELERNIDAYRQGGGKWGTWALPSGETANYVRYLQDADVYCKHHILADKNKIENHTYWEVLEKRPLQIPRPKGGPTWCNQWLGVYSRHYYDIDIDITYGKESDANNLIEKLKGGDYNTSNGKWIECFGFEDALSKSTSPELYLVAALFYNPGGIGHVAVLRPDGQISQAGVATGTCMSLMEGFGRYADQVEYWALELLDGSEDENE